MHSLCAFLEGTAPVIAAVGVQHGEVSCCLRDRGRVYVGAVAGFVSVSVESSRRVRPTRSRPGSCYHPRRVGYPLDRPH